MPQATGGLSTYYIGLSMNTTTLMYDWLDGTTAGNGAVSNYDPYAHWWVPVYTVPAHACPTHAAAVAPRPHWLQSCQA